LSETLDEENFEVQGENIISLSNGKHEKVRARKSSYRVNVIKDTDKSKENVKSEDEE